MNQSESDFLDRVQKALDKLVAKFICHPDVIFIDAGYSPAEGGESGEKVVLRIHVRESWPSAKTEERTIFPEQVDGIPVVVIPGDFRLETGSPTFEE